MLRRLSLLVVVGLAIPSPALAREERHEIDVPATRLDQAIQSLGRQTGSSIGFRDRRVADLRVRAVSGDLTAGEALVLMLEGSGARARRVASGSFLIERAAAPQRSAARRQPAAASAPSPPPRPEPIEILVTATKRNVPLGAYPGMVHVIEGDRISVADGRQGTDALGSTTASVVSTHLGPGRNKLFIRGIADSSFVGPTQATVGQYWGNSRITYASPDPSLKLYDVGRIEVLEGPQGTLYGAGSLGGIVRVLPREPRLDAVEGTAWMGLEAVSHGDIGYDGGAVLNLPLIEDRLALRAVGFGSVENGYIDDVGRSLKDVNDVESFGGRLLLRYAGADGLMVDASLVGQRIDGADGQYAEVRWGDLARSSSIAQPFRNDFLLADIVVRKSWDDLELTASAAYADQYVFEQFQGRALTDPTNSLVGPAADAAQAIFSQTNRGDMFTAELRLARNSPGGTGWLMAASYLRNDADAERSMNVGGSASSLTGVGNKVEEATAYGEATFALADNLLATVGGRLTISHLSGDALDPVLPEQVLAIDPSAERSRTESQFLPSAALAYRPGAGLTVFARYQEGFRPGGIAVRREYVQQFRSDSVHTLESGARYDGADFDVKVSASWTDWSDIQADLIDGYSFPTTTNVGDGRVFSLGVSGSWRPLRALELEASAYLNNSEVTQPYGILIASYDSRGEGGTVEPARTNRLPNIADAMAHFSFNWGTPVGDNFDFDLSGYARYVGKSVLGVGPLLGRLQGDYLDTGIEAQLSRGNVRYSLSLTNLLNSTGNRFTLGSPFQIRDGDQITPLKPRSIRLGAQIDF